MIETERKQKIWEEIIDEAKRNYPRQMEGEMSVTEFAKMLNVGRDYARKILDELVENGKLKVRQTRKARFYTAV